MKKLIILFLLLSFSFPLEAKTKSKTVKAEGIAPIIEGDITSAKKKSLDDALKNALGLVVGIYVSQEAYTSKSMLLEDNILSQTQGYIEKYKILKTSREKDFFKTKVKATIRREDLSKKIKELDLEPKNLGNPTIGFDIKEYKDDVLTDPISTTILGERFINSGFIVKDSGNIDIIVKGRIDTYPASEQSYEGLMLYRAVLSLTAIKRASNKIIRTYKDVAGGVDVNKNASSKNSILNAANKISKNITKDVVDFLVKESVIHLKLNNISDMAKLSEIVLSIRSLIEVRNCLVISFEEPVAVIDINMKKGTSQNLAKRLESNLEFKIESIETYGIEATIK